MLLGAGLAAFTVFLFEAFREPHQIVIRHYDVEMPGLPESANGLRIAHLSDLHCSAITPPGLIRKIVAKCNAEAADAVVMTGDYVSRRNSYLPLSLARLWAKPVMHYAEQMATELAALRAPLGVFAVPGNHDHSKGRFDAIAKLMNAAGVTTLLNQNTRLNGLALAGLDDLRAGRPDLDAAFEGIDADEAQLVLSHNPRMLARVADRNCLLLAGHTHAGQVHLPLTSYQRTPSDMEGSVLQSGWYRDNRARLYVSSGLGSVHFPVRYDCPPEIVVFTLRQLKSKEQK